MSSSPSQLVPSVAFGELRLSPSSPANNGSPAAARVSDGMHPPPGGRQVGGSDVRPRYIQIGGSSCEESAGCRVPVVASAAISSASAQTERFVASSAALNPFAREFVPGSAVSPPSNEEFIAGAWSRGLSTSMEDGSERVSGDVLEVTETKLIESSQGQGSRRSGALATALQHGQTGQGRTGSVPRGGQGGTESMSSQSVAGPGKRGQFTSANHLLNFQYDPIVRPSPSPRIPYPRKVQKAQPFNKELFLQANFRFLVSDFGDYLLNSLDPDKMLQWEDVAALNVSAPVPVQCPICLEIPPVCPQITSCGHIFCFSCVLRYFHLGNNELRSDHFKKCPLCFAITSSKELRTVFVETVHNYQVGDMIELTLLNRSKGSIIPFEKSEGVMASLPYSKDGQFHRFSKFTLTSDATQTTNKAIAELHSWMEKAQKEAGEDIDMIPFALLAIEHLHQRKSAWNEHRTSGFLSSSPPVRQRIMAQTKEALAHSSSHGLKLSDAESDSLEGSKQGVGGKKRVDVASETEAAMEDLKGRAGWVYENAFSDDEGTGLPKSRETSLNDDAIESQTAGFSSNFEDNMHEKASDLEHPGVHSKDFQQAAKREDEDDDCYAFFQCADGQPLIMHPLNMKCLLQHYGSYENLPSRLQVKILEMEGQTQTEVLRKRYRYLSHLPLTTNFWFCEVDLKGNLPWSAFIPFNDELRYREARRRRRQKQEQVERLREEKMSATLSRNSPPTISVPLIEDHYEDMPSLISGSTESTLESLVSIQGPTDQRKLFSQVTRLGFASAHDAPDLTPATSGDVSAPSQEKAGSSAWPGASGKAATMSFADIIQAQPLKASPSATNGADAHSQSGSKRNKKSSKILLSTAGGRRY
ncbi:hypothetical protein GOP47_0010672 [Adiantum capillus-veneris]|uniref:RING-type domain-containing protein n=1 Tax=Adiantum capillus-veneris TaxID=13818 RepID=A0A9D4ZIY5_ADICA|nr:hypothetical protein GOP47_0010672 [Adiantum capillus-veneris]